MGRYRGGAGEVQGDAGRYRGDAGEVQGRCRGGTGEVQGRCRGDRIYLLIGVAEVVLAESVTLECDRIYS